VKASSPFLEKKDQKTFVLALPVLLVS